MCEIDAGRPAHTAVALAWAVGGLTALMLAGCGSTRLTSAQTDPPRVPRMTITIDPQIGETFALAPSSAAPKLTAQEAWQRYAELADSKRTTIPSFVTARLGLLTLPVGPADAPGTGRLVRHDSEAYTAYHELAYGYSWHSCPVYVGGPGMRPPPPTLCIEWTFLNANTAKQIDTTWQTTRR